MNDQIRSLALKIVIILSILLSLNNVTMAQESQNKPINSSSYYFELGGIYYYFRDEIASELNYEGLGGSRIGLGYNRSNNKIQQNVNLLFEYGRARYRKVKNENFTDIYRLSGSYSLNWQNPILENKLYWIGGGTFSSEALYLIYPYLIGNNADTYSIDLLALGPNLGASYLFKKSKLGFFTNLNLMEWNFRPKSYNGVSPEKVFSESAITSIRNNFNLTLKTTYSYQIKKSILIELMYIWNYRLNSSTIKELNYAQHNINLRIYLTKRTIK